MTPCLRLGEDHVDARRFGLAVVMGLIVFVRRRVGSDDITQPQFSLGLKLG